MQGGLNLQLSSVLIFSPFNLINNCFFFFKFQIAEIKKNSQIGIFYDALADHIPQPREDKSLKNMFYDLKKQTDIKFGIKRRIKEDSGFLSAKLMMESRMKKLKTNNKGQKTLDSFLKPKSETKEEENNHKNYSNDFESKIDQKEIKLDENNHFAEEIGDKNFDNNLLKPSEVPDMQDYLNIEYKSNNIVVDNLDKDEETIHRKNSNKHHHKNSKDKVEIAEDKDSKKSKGDKQKIGQLIVQLLMPAYSQKKFSSKDVFKSVARKVTHDVMDKDLSGINKSIT